MDPNQQPPQYPPQFFYPVPGAVDPNQQMYPPQGVPQPMMMQPGMVPPPYVVPQQPQPMMAPQTTGYVVQQPQSPMMTVAPTMSHHVIPNTIPQQVAYVTPTPDDAALLDPNNQTLMLDRSIKERLFDREYTVDTSAWVSEAWDIYKKNYAVFILWSLISIGISFIPYFGGFLTALMSYSFIAAINDTLRPSRVVLNFKNFTHLFINMKYGLHMLLLSILTGLIVAAGLIALVVPGLYFMVVLTYTTPVYIEYRTLGLSLTESIFVSSKVLHKRFCGILGFLIVCFLLILAGALALGVGLLITYPLVHITMSIAFREIFAFRENHLYAVANLEQI